MMNRIPALTRLNALGSDQSDLAFQLRLTLHGVPPLAQLIERLGPAPAPSGVWDWEKDTYSFSFNEETGESTLLVDEETTLGDVRKALDAFRWDSGLTDHVLTRAEWWACFEAGRKHAEGIEMEVPRMSVEDLRAFVRDYVAGHIYTDRDVPRDMVGMVFMPVAFGALNPVPPTDGRPGDAAWERLQTLPYSNGPQEPPQEEPPKKPEPEDHPEPPKPPEPLTLVQPDPEQVERLERAVEWDRAEPSALQAYLDSIKQQNARLQAEYEEGPLAIWEAQQEVWKAQCQAIDESNSRLDQQHAEARRQWQSAMAERRHDRQEWQRAKERNNASYAGFTQQRLRDLGCIWEKMGDRTTAPRSINGLPMFFSCRIMHQEDLRRAEVAIQREIERNKEIEV